MTGLRAVSSLDPGRDLRGTPRRGPYDRLRALAGVRSAPARIRGCSRRSVSGVVELGRSLGREPRGVARGLQLCESAWCPVCGPRVRAERASLVGAAASEWVARGGSLVLLTLTHRHGLCDNPATLVAGHYRARARVTRAISAVAAALRPAPTRRALDLARGSRGLPYASDPAAHCVDFWREIAARSTGGARWVLASEVTTGRAGAHPHLHALIFVEPGATPAVEDGRAVDVEEALFDAWNAAVVDELGPAYACTREHGVHARVWTAEQGDAGALGRYLCGFSTAGQELAGVSKSGRNGVSRCPDELLDGDGADVAHWCALVGAYRGRKLISWSDRQRFRRVCEYIAVERRGSHRWTALDPRLRRAADLSVAASQPLAWIGAPAWRWLLDSGQATSALAAAASGARPLRRWWSATAPAAVRNLAIFSADLGPDCLTGSGHSIRSDCAAALAPALARSVPYALDRLGIQPVDANGIPQSAAHRAAERYPAPLALAA